MRTKWRDYSTGGIVGGLVGVIIGAPLDIAWNAWVLFKLWQWYLPNEVGLPKFSVCFGIALTFELLRIPLWRPELSTKESRLRLSVYRVIDPAFILAIGWLGTLLLGR